MIKNTNIQPLKILNVADFLNGEITVEKIITLNPRYNYSCNTETKAAASIADALRGIRSQGSAVRCPRLCGLWFSGSTFRGDVDV